MTKTTAARRQNLRSALAKLGVLGVAVALAAVLAQPAAADDTPLPAAPVVAPPPIATVYQAYTHQLVELGEPAASITVYRHTPTGLVAQPDAATYALGHGLTLTAATGAITRPVTASDTTELDAPTFTVVANNGVGGASAAAAATDTTPEIVEHDVTITFEIPVHFADVGTGHQFAGPIYRMAHEGITQGNPDGTFKPAADISRQAFARFVVNYLNRVASETGLTFAAFGLPTPLKTGSCNQHGQASTFVDVSEANPFCTDINQLVELGITTGYGNEFSFAPNRNISRQGISAMLYRLDLVTQGFTDAALISAPVACSGATGFADVGAGHTFCGHIQWMNSTGISTGYGGTHFRPSNASSRQATIAFIDRHGVLLGLGGFGN